MDSKQKSGTSFDVEEIRARRHARRARREGLVYNQVQEALTDIEGAFSDRTARVWGMPDGESARRVQGHAGSQAAMFVSETLGEFHVPGMVNTKFVSMGRNAGAGGHGITDGVITVEVEVRPIHGMAQTLEVPVQVKQGFLVRPGVMYHEGVPYVMSQSALDEIMHSASHADLPSTDRKNQYSPPASYSGLPHTASVCVDGRGMSQKEMGVPTKEQYLQQEQAKKEQEEAEAKAKARRKERNLSQRPPMIARLSREIFVPSADDENKGVFIRAGAPILVLPDQDGHDEGIENSFGQDLQGANLEGEDLRRFNSESSNLARADMRGTNLRGADLTGVVMSGAEVEDANLTDAMLRGVDATNANFSRAIMRGANIQNAKLDGCNFSGADLSNAFLQGSNLSGANFTNANVSGAFFADANLAGANFQGANIKGAKLTHALNADLTGAIGTPKPKKQKKVSSKLVHIRDGAGVEALVDPAYLIWE